MKTKHTPGPWEVKAGSWDHDGCVRYSLEGITDLKAADARLIAAAPELLEALQGLVRVYEALPGAVTHNGSRHSHAVYAIRKATGEES